MKVKCDKCKRAATIQFSRLAYFIEPVRVEKVQSDFCTQHGNDMFNLWSSSVEKTAKFQPTLVKF